MSIDRCALTWQQSAEELPKAAFSERGLLNGNMFTNGPLEATPIAINAFMRTEPRELSEPDKAASSDGAPVLSKGATKQRYDAGMRDLDYYAGRLPRWRHTMRQWLLPIVRAETPYLALLQEKFRCPLLDSYFAFTANLGTHTFFMIMLPILFWCGYVNLGRASVHILAFGVYWSGYIKDLLCLPRPLSPPLQRVTMSGSAALEYGFPSTHSTNAVSVAVYAMHVLSSSEDALHPAMCLVLQISLYLYAGSIVLGRLYCGMHGFFDVTMGSMLGASLSALQLNYGDAFDSWITSGTCLRPLIVMLIVLALVRIHPEPADDCPCFDDSVAFAGVMIGIEVGAWHYASTRQASVSSMPSSKILLRPTSIGWAKGLIRILLGVLIIFAWRGTMKPTLLKVLPPIFRFVEQLGLLLPRKFFLGASQYTTIPTLRRDDNVIPAASEIPSLLNNLRHPRRRAVSIGPQSAADAYETLAYRQKRRRESISAPAVDSPPSPSSQSGFQNQSDHITSDSTRRRKSASESHVSNQLPPTLSRLRAYEQMMGTGEAKQTHDASPASNISSTADEAESSAETRKREEKEDRELLSRVQKPRVRYDVEVVTKLIVYTGIAWLACEGNPMLFELCGLGIAASVA